MQDQFERTRLLLGEQAMQKLFHSRVAVFGVGGVGGFAVEALARSGIGTLDLIDHDKVSLSNLNRQIVATHGTIGEYKVDVAARRILDINPHAAVHTHKCFFLPENADRFDFSQYDYVIDAIDTLTAKIELILRAKQAGVPIICAMGAGNKLDPTRFRVADIYQTRVCPLARRLRGELKKRGVKSLKVVYSDEPPVRPLRETACGECAAPDDVQARVPRRDTPGSTAFVPSVVGLILAAEVIRDLTAETRNAQG